MHKHVVFLHAGSPSNFFVAQHCVSGDLGEDEANVLQSECSCDFLDIASTFVLKLLGSSAIANLWRVVDVLHDASNARFIGRVLAIISVKVGHPIDFTAGLRPKANELADLLVVHEDNVVHVPVLLDAQVYRGGFALGTLAFWVRSMLSTIRALLVLVVAGRRGVKSAVLAFCVCRMLAFLLFIQNNLVERLVFCIGLSRG